MRGYWLIVLSFVLSACRLAGVQAVAPPSLPVQASPTALQPEIENILPSLTSSAVSPAPAELPLEVPSNTPAPPPSQAAVLPSASDVHWDQVVGDLNSPVGLENAGDGSGRLFIVEQAGRILILKDGKTLDPPFLDIRDRVGKSGSEQGLLGLAFHPRYAENGFFYVNYTDLNGDTNISRFSVVRANPDVADPSSEQRLIFVEQPYPNHNGGSVVFGPDGYLYLGLGDGGSGGDPQGNAQSPDTFLGKILRVDINSGDPYAIPADNPFVGDGGLPEIWAYGLRNPWRFSFDRMSGDAYIADVGQNEWEEIDYLPAGSPPGANFGWDRREGLHHFEGVNLANNFVDPVAEYDHSQGCSVTGGVVYRGSNLVGWQGVYLYGDYCSGRVWGLLHTPDGHWQNELLFKTGLNISSFGVNESGEIYLLDHNGAVYRLVQ